MKFEHRLAEESAAWVSEGLITAEQRDALLDRHSVSTSSTRFLAIFATIGAALFLVGVSLLIKAHWERIGDWFKILGLLVLLSASYAVGWRWKVAPGHRPKSGDAFLMVGSVLFFLGIVLVSQIFHLNSRPANGVLLWWVGIAAVPWLVRAKGAQLISLVAWLFWLMLECSAEDSWIRLMPPGVRNAEFVYAAVWFLLGLTVYAVGVALRRSRADDFAEMHETLGLVVASGALYAIAFSWSTDRWFAASMTAAEPPAADFFLGLAIVALAIAAWRNLRELKLLVWVLALGLVPTVAELFGLELHDSGWLWGGVASIAMFLLNIGMIRTGVAEGRESWINLGIVGIALNIFTRYFVLFGTMLEGGLFFIVTGLGVLGLGYYLERKRRALVRRSREEVAS